MFNTVVNIEIQIVTVVNITGFIFAMIGVW